MPLQPILERAAELGPKEFDSIPIMSVESSASVPSPISLPVGCLSELTLLPCPRLPALLLPS